MKSNSFFKNKEIDKRIRYLKTQPNEKPRNLKINNINSVILTNNYVNKKPEKNKSRRSSKINYDNKLLLNILNGRSNESINKNSPKSRNYSKSNFLTLFSYKKEAPLNLSKKFKLIPNITKLNHLTDENISELIQKKEKSPRFKNKYKNKIESIQIINKKFKIDNKNSITPLMKFIKDSKKFKEGKKNFSEEKKNNKLIFLHNNILNNNYINTEILESFDVDFTTQSGRIKYLYTDSNINEKNINSIKKNNGDESKIKRNSLRRSSIDRLVFSLEKPYDCFEEHLKDKKPEDKYQFFKNQLINEKEKLYKLIKGNKLNQIKNESSKKKYYYKIFSDKNKNKNKNTIFNFY